jgi:hypothetical protein
METLPIGTVVIGFWGMATSELGIAQEKHDIIMAQGKNTIRAKHGQAGCICGQTVGKAKKVLLKLASEFPNQLFQQDLFGGPSRTRTCDRRIMSPQL